MLGSESLLQLLLSARAAGDKTDLKRHVMALATAGYAPVLVKPDSKFPLCPLSANLTQKADKQAIQAAAEAGHPNPEQATHKCGIYHALDTPAEVTRLYKYAEAVWGVDTMNVGLELGKSNLLVVDADTAMEVSGFLQTWGAYTGQDESKRIPTVKTPGVKREGDWVHSGGGHWWFQLPAGTDLSHTASGTMKLPGGAAVYWRDRQALIPPSTRPEGPYTCVGTVEEAPAWLLALIRAEAETKSKEPRSNLDGPTAIDDWASGITWSEILLEDGWRQHGLESCGCVQWTAPGPHGSPKSATAHEDSCTYYDTSSGHAPLKLWTDNPPEFLMGDQKAFSKFQYISARDNNSNHALAARDLGIARPDVELGAVDMDDDRSLLAELAVDPVKAMLGEILTSSQLDNVPKPEPLIAGFLDFDTVARITGKSNHGKSFVALDMAACVATGKAWHGNQVQQGPVVYMAAEGSRGIKNRLRAWESEYNEGRAVDAVHVMPRAVQANNSAEWPTFVRAMKQLKPAMIILDTQARVTVGSDENSAMDMGVLVHNLELLREHTGACVVVVHHLGHTGEHGRGSTAVYGALGSELRVVRSRNRLTIVTEKQRDQEFARNLHLDMARMEDSLILKSENQGEDPMAGQTIIDGASPREDQIVYIAYSGFNNSVGGSKADHARLMKKHYGAQELAFAEAWGKVIDQGLLAACESPVTGNVVARYRPSTGEIDRLGLRNLPKLM